MVVVEHPFEEGTREVAQRIVRILLGLLTRAKSCGLILFLISSPGDSMA